MSDQGGVVLDASAAITWVLRDVNPEDESKIDALFIDGFMFVPEHWHSEVANAFHSATRAGRVDEEFIVDLCKQFTNSTYERMPLRTLFNG